MKKVWELEEIKTLVAKKSFFALNNDFFRELEELWVREPENMATAQYGRDWGFFVGMEDVRRGYLAEHSELGNGYCCFTPLNTPVLHIAADGETAYGLWYSLSNIAYSVGKGQRGYMMFERYFFDFKKEGDGWKIWHMFIGLDSAFEAGENQGAEPADAIPEGHPVNPAKDGFGTPTYPMDAFNAKWSWCNFPVVPAAHDNYDIRMSCSMEGFMNYKASRMDLKTVYERLGGAMR